MTAAASSAGRCGYCEEDLAHCHGTFVRHEDGSWECTDDTCEGPALHHRWIVSCEDVVGGCCPTALAATA